MRIPRAAAGAATLLLLLAATTAAGAARLEGRVTLRDGSRDRPPRGDERVLVYFVPDERRPVTAPPEPFEVVTVKKEFVPRAMIVPVGSTVRFPNQDRILHNVFSVSGANRFDLGFYRRGDGKEVTLRHPGVVRVFCNVHHDMVAYLVVVDTPFYTNAGDDGRFALDGVPAGAGTLHVWFERSEPVARRLELPEDGPVAVELEVEKPKVPRHLNKFNLPYSRGRRDRY